MPSHDVFRHDQAYAKPVLKIAVRHYNKGNSSQPFPLLLAINTQEFNFDSGTYSVKDRRNIYLFVK